MNMDKLKDTFQEAISKKSRFIGVQVKMPGIPKAEIIVNPYANFKSKLEYYVNAYNEDLTHKYSKDVEIIGVAHGQSFFEIALTLGEEHVW